MGYHGPRTLHSAGSAIRSGLRENLQKQLFGVIGNMHLGPLLLHKRGQKPSESGVFLMIQ